MLDPAAILGANILVVDDQPANVLLLERMLATAGYTNVTSTRDPLTVGDLHRTNRYDLILLDLQMPVMDGFAVMEELKQMEPDGILPVLVITAQPQHKLRALRAGARDFVSKPFDIAEIQTRVHNMLEVRLLNVAIQRKNEEITKLFDQVVAERKISERLVLGAPSDSIAARLQVRPDVTTASFASVTVLIADVVGLSDESISDLAAEPTSLIEEAFADFDGAVAARDVRKVKTLGNSYLAATGLPTPTDDHGVRTADLALDLLDIVARLNERTGARLQARIGLASGPVVAAVIGRRQYLYDVWGETVTIAALMESHGVAGRIQVAAATRSQLGTGFQLERRGTLDVPGAGALETWFINGRTPVPG